MRGRADEVRALIAATYAGELETGSQASAALLADAGVLDADGRSRAVARLLGLLAEGGDQLTVGEIGLPALLRTLAAAEEHEQIYRSVVQTSGPGYGQMLADGATSLCEHWPGLRSRRSANHFMLGGIGTWFLQSVAGLAQAPDGVGWRGALVSPRPLASVPSASVRFDSPAGAYAVDWQQDGESLRLDVAVPDGATVECLPPPEHTGTVQMLGAGTHQITYRRRRR